MGEGDIRGDEAKEQTGSLNIVTMLDPDWLISHDEFKPVTTTLSFTLKLSPEVIFQLLLDASTSHEKLYALYHLLITNNFRMESDKKVFSINDDEMSLQLLSESLLKNSIIFLQETPLAVVDLEEGDSINQINSITDDLHSVFNLLKL